MTTIRLNILEEHALEIIRVLEKLRAVEVVVEPNPPVKPAPKKWGGIIKNPSDELLAYADNVRAEWDDRI